MCHRTGYHQGKNEGGLDVSKKFLMMMLVLAAGAQAVAQPATPPSEVSFFYGGQWAAIIFPGGAAPASITQILSTNVCKLAPKSWTNTCPSSASSSSIEVEVLSPCGLSVLASVFTQWPHIMQQNVPTYWSTNSKDLIYLGAQQQQCTRCDDTCFADVEYIIYDQFSSAPNGSNRWACFEKYWQPCSNLNSSGPAITIPAVGAVWQGFIACIQGTP